MLKKVLLLIMIINIGATLSFAEGVTLIQLESGANTPSNAENERLKERVRNLELAVRQLQTLAEKKITKAKPSIIHCYGRDNINQTYTATGSTEVEAKGKILSECLFCKAEKITCD